MPLFRAFHFNGVLTYFYFEADRDRVDNFEENVGDEHANRAVQAVVYQIPHASVTCFGQHLEIDGKSDVEKVREEA
jgi:hypothetical protein